MKAQKFILHILVLLGFLIPKEASAQQIPDSCLGGIDCSEMKRMSDSLIRIGADTVITSFTYVDGWPKYMDSAGTYTVDYIFWTKNQKAYGRKIISSDHFPSRSYNCVIAYDVFIFLTTYYDYINREVILPYSIKVSRNGFVGYEPISSTHREYTVIRAYAKEKILDTYISPQDLRDNIFNKESPENVNLEFNLHTKLYELYKMLKRVMTE